MRFLTASLFTCTTVLLSGVSALPHFSSIEKRCTNSATDRSCWGDYDLSTDYYNEVPDTGNTVEVRIHLP